MSARKLGNVHGVVFLDKPYGLSSNRALQTVKRLIKAGKAGHTGALDPMATGLLPLCFGEATKFSSYLLDASKRYQAEITLGQTSNTYDAEGELSELSCIPELNEGQIEQVLQDFRGEIQQVPPIYSALKKDGVPMYKRAMRGEEIILEPRPVTIYQLDFISFEANKIKIDVYCSKGTYIRSLAHDIGQAIGCGAHLSGLRRVHHAGYTLDDSSTLESIEVAAAQGVTPPPALKSIELLIQHLPKAVVANAALPRITHGNDICDYSSEVESGLVRVYAENGSLLGVAEIIEKTLFARRLLRSFDI